MERAQRSEHKRLLAQTAMAEAVLRRVVANGRMPSTDSLRALRRLQKRADAARPGDPVADEAQSVALLMRRIACATGDEREQLAAEIDAAARKFVALFDGWRVANGLGDGGR